MSRSSSSRTRRRGGEEFLWPAGWSKLAINVSVLHKTIDRDGHEWLDRDEGWPVAFHGTSGGNRHVIRDIIRNGFKVRGGESSARNGELFGRSIYCTPDPSFAATYAAKDPWCTASGHVLEVVFQVRVRPGRSCEYTHKKGRCWVVERSKDIRPCGIPFRECDRMKGAVSDHH